jgi:hypothetical protein
MRNEELAVRLTNWDEGRAIEYMGSFRRSCDRINKFFV